MRAMHKRGHPGTRSVTNRIIFWYKRIYAECESSRGKEVEWGPHLIKGLKNPQSSMLCVHTHFLHNPLFHNQISLRQHHTLCAAGNDQVGFWWCALDFWAAEESTCKSPHLEFIHRGGYYYSFWFFIPIYFVTKNNNKKYFNGFILF